MAMPMPYEIDLNDLEFFEKCGAGSFGSVYRAKWISRDMEVAAKKASVIEKEASVLSKLSHRNIIQFYGAVLKEPNCFLVTEYAENGSLYDFLQQPGNSLDFDSIINWAKDIARGINYLHNLPDKIIHRDLKSQNVVITRDWDCKICDFGSSRLFVSTTKMSFVGTYPWMAPEVIRSEPVSKSCDTWSYGVCLWELLTKEVPFKSMVDFQVIFAVGNGRRLTIPSSCPPCFGQLMKKCWKLEPKKRPTFKQILTALDNMCEDESLPSITNSFVGNKSAWGVDLNRGVFYPLEVEHTLSDVYVTAECLREPEVCGFKIIDDQGEVKLVSECVTSYCLKTVFLDLEDLFLEADMSLCKMVLMVYEQLEECLERGRPPIIFEPEIDVTAGSKSNIVECLKVSKLMTRFVRSLYERDYSSDIRGKDSQEEARGLKVLNE